MASQLPHLPDVKQVSTNITRILGGNPSKFTLQGTNTYLLGRGRERILIDAGQGEPAWPPLLSKVLKEENATVEKCLLSHWHGDHVGGIQDLLKICPEVEIHKCTPSLDPDGTVTAAGVEVGDIHDGDTFATSTSDDGAGFEVRALHCPGHTKDHMAFIVTRSSDESEVGCMFTADNVLGHGTAVFEDLAVYLRSLELMKGKIGKGGKAYPGHGEVIDDGRERIQQYIQHRQMREDEALLVLKYGRKTKPEAGGEVGEMGMEVVPGKEWGSMEMVQVIYANVPENLHAPAEKGLLMVLEKLRGEGRVIRTETGMWRIGEKAIL